MAKAADVERRILKIEGFPVEFVYKGKNVRGDKQLPKQYKANRKSKDSFTADQFKKKLKKQFPGYDFDIKYPDSEKVRGQTKLSTLRCTYKSGK